MSEGCTFKKKREKKGKEIINNIEKKKSIGCLDVTYIDKVL